MYTKLYKIIAIYEGPNSYNNPENYLHLHALDHNFFSPYDDLITDFSLAKPRILYQWGTMKKLYEHRRSCQVTEKTRQKYGNIGMGAAGKGSNEQKGDFYNGGEGFIYGEHAYRITKANKAVKMSENDGYWMLQLTSFTSPIREKNLQEANSRKELTDFILSKIGNNQTFVTSFNARFNSSNFTARSNGIYPEDLGNNDQFGSMSAFSGNQVIGGHVLGDSLHPHDSKHPENQEAKFQIKIEGDIVIQPIEEILLIEEEE